MYDDAKKDPNWIAYTTDLASGTLDNLRGQYVAYRGGTLLTSAPTQDQLLIKVRNEFADLAGKGEFIHQVGVDEAVSIPTFRIK